LKFNLVILHVSKELNEKIKTKDMEELLMDLIKTNVKSTHIKGDLLVYGTCIKREHPDILKSFKEIKLHTCLEEEHLNKVAWKLATIIRENKLRKISTLTMDGSPHCVQLHYILEDLKRIFPAIEVNHFVVEDGKLFKISSDAVRRSRHLKEIEESLG
jgi:hypothetical protein